MARFWPPAQKLLPNVIVGVVIGVLLGGGVAACGDDSAGPADAPTDRAEPTGELVFSVPDVPDGGTVPVEFTCDGANQVPVVEVVSVPDQTAELALIVDDPDAPRDDPFVHWVVYGIPASSGQISDEMATVTYGPNDAGTTAWFGPCPPEGDDPHGYRWRLFALSERLESDDGLDGRQLEDALAGVVVDIAEWSAFFRG